MRTSCWCSSRRCRSGSENSKKFLSQPVAPQEAKGNATTQSQELALQLSTKAARRSGKSHGVRELRQAQLAEAQERLKLRGADIRSVPSPNFSR